MGGKKGPVTIYVIRIPKMRIGRIPKMTKKSQKCDEES